MRNAGMLKPKCQPGCVELRCPARSVRPTGDRRARSSGRRDGSEPVEQVDDVGGESDADGHVGDGVFEDEVPADDPRDEFAHRGVGVGVGGAGDGDHGGEFGIAEAGEAADDGDQDQRDGRAPGLRRDGRRGAVMRTR